MDSITLENYRCFGKEQTARLAPLTLLVGPNSTGKTSFLALIRAIWDTVFGESIPNFREFPYDLGSFQDIAHNRGARGSQASEFGAGFDFSPIEIVEGPPVHMWATFENRDTAPFPALKQFFSNDAVVEVRETGSGEVSVRSRDGDGAWQDYAPLPGMAEFSERFPLPDGFPKFLLALHRQGADDLPGGDRGQPACQHLVTAIVAERWAHKRPFANAAIRSRPRRTYDPILQSPDSEGEYIPSFLAGLARTNPYGWQLLKQQLEHFGQKSELFNEISVRSLGNSDGDPFQLQIRKFGNRRKGRPRNLIDVGYGISQVLPTLTEMFRDNGPSTFLLQQPEVHLHPSAQAALGSLFCQIAAGGKQLVVETHSDYLIDRVRMDVRDGTTDLQPEDVSILYFEPGDLDVKIHSIRIDEMGNVLNAPHSYGEFFMAETRRSIGL